MQAQQGQPSRAGVPCLLVVDAALLKGWIDRVFVNGWALEVGAEGGMKRNLRELTTHLVPVAGDDAGVYDRHGYEEALRTQIQHGIIDYCGSRRGVTAFVYESEQDNGEAREHTVLAAINAVSQSIKAQERNPGYELTDQEMGTTPAFANPES